MCKQFKVDRIVCLPRPTNHMKRGQVFAVVGNDLYLSKHHAKNPPVFAKEAWPVEGMFWRDGWSYFIDMTERNHGPYFLEVLDMKDDWTTIINYK